jgi:bacteriorhodopsin
MFKLTLCEEATSWVTFGIFVLSSFIFLFRNSNADVGYDDSTTTKSQRYRLLTSAVTIIAATMYFFMAQGYGIEVAVSGVSVEFWWLRYLDWLITTPLLLLDLALIAGIDVWDTFALMVADVLMVAVGLVAGNPQYGHTWECFGVSLGFFLLTLYIIGEGMWERADDPSTTEEKERVMKTLLWLTVITWCTYPLYFALEYSKVLKNTNSNHRCALVLLYALSDVIAKAVFGFILLLNDDILHTPMPLGAVESIPMVTYNQPTVFTSQGVQ